MVNNIEYSIFQIEHVEQSDKRFNHIHYRIFEELKENIKTINLKKDNYKKIYTGEVQCTLNDENSFDTVLEYLFVKFNTNIPLDYSGRSLSVSDVIKIGERYFHCQRIGFKEIAII